MRSPTSAGVSQVADHLADAEYDQHRNHARQAVKLQNGDDAGNQDVGDDSGPDREQTDQPGDQSDEQ